MPGEKSSIVELDSARYPGGSASDFGLILEGLVARISESTRMETSLQEAVEGLQAQLADRQEAVEGLQRGEAQSRLERGYLLRLLVEERESARELIQSQRSVDALLIEERRHRSQLSQECADLHTELERATSTLASIYASKTWRVVNLWRSFRNWLFRRPAQVA